MEASDTSYMIDAMTYIGDWTERSVTVFAFSSVGTNGTAAEAGDPSSVTFGTRTDMARIQTVSMKDIERSSGKYQASDDKFALRGSFTKDDNFVYDSGTFHPIDGPWKVWFGSSLFYQAVCREVKS